MKETVIAKNYTSKTNPNTYFNQYFKMRFCLNMHKMKIKNGWQLSVKKDRRKKDLLILFNILKWNFV